MRKVGSLGIFLNLRRNQDGCKGIEGDHGKFSNKLVDENENEDGNIIKQRRGGDERKS